MDKAVTGSSSKVCKPPYKLICELAAGPNAISLIQRFEGFSLKARPDAKHGWQIGYGHWCKVRMDDLKDLDAAIALLRSDILHVDRVIFDTVRVPMTQNQYDALADWIYNLGSGEWQRSSAITRLNDGCYDQAIHVMREYIHAGGHILPGLIARREAEALLWSSDRTTESRLV